MARTAKSEVATTEPPVNSHEAIFINAFFYVLIRVIVDVRQVAHSHCNPPWWVNAQAGLNQLRPLLTETYSGLTAQVQDPSI